MPQISIEVAGRTHRLECDEGEQERLHELAGYFREKVDKIKEDAGPVGDDRLLVMAALMITDELWESKERVMDLETMPDTPSQANGGIDDKLMEKLAVTFETAAQKVQSLTLMLTEDGTKN